MGKPVLLVSALVFSLALYVWAQVIDQSLPGHPLGIASSEPTVDRELVEGAPDGDVYHY